MSRFKLNDSILDTVIKMSDGNPGAMMALTELVKDNNIIDQDSVLGPLGAVLYLDQNEIYGTDIYILFNDKCNKSTRKLIMLLRVCQLGEFSRNRLKELSLDQMNEVNISSEEWNSIEKTVKSELPNFN